MPAETMRIKDGALPYASELFGVYQPLVGWVSRQATNRAGQERRAAILEAIVALINETQLDRVFETKPLDPSATRMLRLPVSLDTLTPNLIQEAASSFIKENGRPPAGDDWRTIVEAVNPAAVLLALAAAAEAAGASDMALFRKANLTEDDQNELQLHEVAGTDFMVARADSIVQPNWLDGGGIDSRAARAADAAPRVSLTREAAIAGMLMYLGRDAPEMLQAMFLPDDSASQVSSMLAIDPIATFGPAIRQEVLSPIGILDLYREYFFELTSFLGPPVGHVWVSPGGSVDLFEIHTRHTIEERQEELTLEMTTRKEQGVTDQDELSTAVTEQNQNNTRLGISASAGVNYGVLHGSASASLSMEASHTTSQQTAHKHTRQQSEKLSEEIRRNFKTTFRTSVELTDTSSRRYVLQNTTAELVNYELRRKMRAVGVRLQHIGKQLCWHVYLDEPGSSLKLSELVHLAKPNDLAAAAVQPPQAPIRLPPKTTDYYMDFRSGETFEFAPTPPAHGYEIEKVRFPEDPFGDPDGEEHDFRVVGMLVHVELRGTKFGLFVTPTDLWGGLPLWARVDWKPPDQTAAEAAYKDALEKYTHEQKTSAHAAYVGAVRERVKLASQITGRPAADLREEERTVIFRRLIGLLTGTAYGTPKQERHLMAELLRSIFDIEQMLYFVAPEWWWPRLRRFNQRVGSSAGDSLSEVDTVSWVAATADSRDAYLVTEESRPAAMGASLGWLLQLDGDEHRNAFLNSPWTKAVVPIRPGREKLAIEWLERHDVEGATGLGATYHGPEDGKLEPELEGMTLRAVLLELASRIGKMSTDMENVLKTEKMFESGADPLKGGFRATAPYEVFDQWIEVLPTDQVVALEYTAIRPD